MIVIVYGTRPEIIKQSPVIKALSRKRLPFVTIHSGQHYDRNLSEIFIEQLGLPQPDYNLNNGKMTPAAQTASMMIGFEQVFAKIRPSVVVVQGDTNTALAAALTARKMRYPVAHIEAGLRSFDHEMPEEQNRVVIDHISQVHYAPTEKAWQYLYVECIRDTVLETGNTIVDVLNEYPPERNPTNAILTTIHREENTRTPAQITRILKKMDKVGEMLDRQVWFPVHPRTRKLIEYVPSKTVFLPPMGYFEFLAALASSSLVITDSGGVQEEACLLGTPCVTLRTTTERPETLIVGANRLARVDTLVEMCQQAITRPGPYRNMFGDGTAGEQIVNDLEKRYG